MGYRIMDAMKENKITRCNTCGKFYTKFQVEQAKFKFFNKCEECGKQVCPNCAPREYTRRIIHLSCERALNNETYKKRT